jgi:Flp pilus assembly pilin Flp
MDIQQKKRAKRAFRRFLKNEEGSSAMEYATMLGLIGVTLLPVVQTLGDKVSGVSREVSDVFSSATEGAPPPPPPPKTTPAPEEPTFQ